MSETELCLPFSGRTPLTRHASYSGAVAAAETRAGKTQRYLELVGQYGPISDHGVAALTSWGLSSVNSIRNGVRELLEEVGHSEHRHEGRKTYRTLYRLRRPG